MLRETCLRAVKSTIDNFPNLGRIRTVTSRYITDTGHWLFNGGPFHASRTGHQAETTTPQQETHKHRRRIPPQYPHVDRASYLVIGTQDQKDNVGTCFRTLIWTQTERIQTRTYISVISLLPLEIHAQREELTECYTFSSKPCWDYIDVYFCCGSYAIWTNSATGEWLSCVGTETTRRGGAKTACSKDAVNSGGETEDVDFIVYSC